MVIGIDDDKYDKEYKAMRNNLMKSAGTNNRQGGQQQQQQIKRNIPPFLLKKPAPEEIHFFGEYKTSAEAETQRQAYEAREANRVAKAAADQAKAQEPGLKLELRKPVYQKKEKATCPKELTDQLQAEFEKIKTAMAASGNMTYKEEKAAPAATRKITELGGQPIGAIKNTKKSKPENTLGGK